MKISQLPVATLVNDADLFPIVQAGVNKSATRGLMTGAGIFYSGNYATLDAAISAIGATAGTLIIHSAIANVANVTVPTTLAVAFTGGGMLSVPNATTVTFNGSFDAPLEPVFTLTGTGVVNFGKSALTVFYPDWWGAIADCNSNGSAGTDNTLPIQQCFTSAKVTADLSVASTTRVKISAGRYRTLPVSLGAGVSLDMEDAVLLFGIGLGGASFATALLTIDGSIVGCYHKGLSAACDATGGSGHKFNPTYWETNIGIKFTACVWQNVTFGQVSGWCIGAQFTGGGGQSGIVSYSRMYQGKFDTNKVNIDIRTTSINFCNECNFRDVQIQSSSNMNAYGTLAGVRFSSDDNGQHGQNNLHFDGFSFEIGDHNVGFNWASGTSKTQYSIYATGETPTTWNTDPAIEDVKKYWSFTSATAACGTDSPPSTDTVVFTSSAGLMGTCANYSLQDDMVIFLTNSGGASGAPTGTTVYTWYWTVACSGKTFKLALTKGGAPIAFTDAGTGTHSIEAQRYTQYTDNAGKVWQCDGVKFRAPVMVDDTGMSQCSFTKARWETGYGPFVHVQYHRRFTTTTYTLNVLEPYGLQPTTYNTIGELNHHAVTSVLVSNADLSSPNVYKTYSTTVSRTFTLDNFSRRYIKSVTGHATIAGMAFLTQTAWDTIIQANATGNNCVLCKEHLSIGFSSSWVPVVFVDMINHKRVVVSGDLIAKSQFAIAKGYDANFKNLALDNFNKTLVGGSRLQTTFGGWFDMIATGNVIGYAIPNATGAARYIMVGLRAGSNQATVRGIQFFVPEGDSTLETPLRVVTPWGLASDLSRSSQGEPTTGYFQQAGEFIKNINVTASDPLGWTVKTAGALAPALANTTAYILGQLAVNGANVYAAQIAGTSGGAAVTNVVGTGTSIDDGSAYLWDYVCPVAAIEVVSRQTKDPTTGTLASATFAQHALTGAQEVINLNTAVTPGTLTTRTATLMVADHGGGVSGSWKVRIVNISANILTVGLGVGVTNPLTTTLTIAANSFGDFLFTATSATAVTIARIGTGTHV